MKVRRQAEVSLLGLVNVLDEKGVVSRREVELNRAEVYESLKPKNIFTVEERREVKTALASLQIPKGTGYAHAISIYAMKDAKQKFSPNIVYCECCLMNLRSTLHDARLKNKQIDRKLAKAILFARNHQVDTCQFPN